MLHSCHILPLWPSLGTSRIRLHTVFHPLTSCAHASHRKEIERRSCMYAVGYSKLHIKVWGIGCWFRRCPRCLTIACRRSANHCSTISNVGVPRYSIRNTSSTQQLCSNATIFSGPMVHQLGCSRLKPFAHTPPHPLPNTARTRTYACNCKSCNEKTEVSCAMSTPDAGDTD